jgi:WD40 repeat protein
MIATAGGDGLVRLWSVADGQQQASLDGQGLCLTHVAISPDGRLIAATGFDNDLRVWELQ